MAQPLADRIAIVTGGDSGIGAACVALFAAHGAHVASIFHHDEQGSAASAEAARMHGRQAVSIQADVGDEKAVEAAFDKVAEQLGQPSILVNSAGINMAGVNVVDMELGQWERMLRTDLTGTFLTSRRLARDLVAAQEMGAIVNITSIHADAVRAGGADYCAAKGGQRNLTETLALELAGSGITVNAVAPGMILTPMNARAMEDAAYRRKLTKHIPIRRAGTPEEVAEIAAFLVSPAARYMTGSTVTVDGGLSLVLGQGA